MVFQTQFIPFYGFLPPTDAIDVINYIAPIAIPAEPGPPGPPGPPGEQGPPGENCMVSAYKTTLISSDYIVEEEDVYIGVDSKSPIEILLPISPEEGSFYIIKLEMGPPIGNRKVTVITDNGVKIDGNGSLTLQNPYESVTLLYRGDKWHII